MNARCSSPAEQPALAESPEVTRQIEIVDAFRLHRREMYYVARSICGESAAADVVQEVFLRMWRSDTFDDTRGTMRSYLLVMTRGVSIDSLRRNVAVERRDDRHARPSTLVDDDLGSEIVARETRDRLARALTQLRPNEREVIERSFYLGQTHREIASTLGIPEGTVKSRIRLGVVKLRRVLHDLSADNQLQTSS